MDFCKNCLYKKDNTNTCICRYDAPRPWGNANSMDPHCITWPKVKLKDSCSKFKDSHPLGDTEKCENCLSFTGNSCRYNAPRPSGDPSLSQCHYVSWPQVNPTDWCGKFEVPKPLEVEKPLEVKPE